MGSESPQRPEEEQRLTGAYHRMLERVKSALDEAENETLPRLQDQIAAAKDKAVELGELTREEAEKLGGYLRRDLTDAADFMAKSGKELGDWLRFDLDLIESRILDMFALMVDHTREELSRLAERARESELLHTGEVTAMGTLRCTNCGTEMHFREPGHIPPCPKCHGTKFSREAE